MKSIFLFLFTPLFCAAQINPVKDSANEWHPYEFQKATNKILRNVLVGAGYTAVVYFTYKYEDKNFQHESQEDKSKVASLILTKGASPLGLGKTQAIALGATTGFAFLTKNKTLKHTVYIWAGTMLLNEVVTSKLKTGFQRHRPNTGDAFNTFDGKNGIDGNRSFPSAHTSNAFATATVFATLYKDKKWVAPFAYGMATMVGISRVYDNAHWASDVLAGAAIGFLSAKTMIATDRLLQKKGIYIYPAWSRGPSLTLGYKFK